MTRRAILALFVVLMIAMLTGCNTVHGFGKDVQSGGKAIEKASGAGQ